MRVQLAAGLVVALIVAPHGQSADPPPSVTSRFLARADEPLTSYRATRHLEARNLRFKREAWLDVRTTLTGRTFEWTVLASGGSDYIIKKVLLPVLKGEAEAVRNPAAKAALTAANYEMADDLPADDGRPRIRLKPHHPDKMLVDGWLTVSPDDADLQEISGRLSKSPSFWTTNVAIRREYARVGGHRVPVAVESTASVRIAGRSTFAMTYQYDEINAVSVAEPPAFKLRPTQTTRLR